MPSQLKLSSVEKHPAKDKIKAVEKNKSRSCLNCFQLSLITHKLKAGKIILNSLP